MREGRGRAKGLKCSKNSVGKVQTMRSSASKYFNPDLLQEAFLISPHCAPNIVCVSTTALTSDFVIIIYLNYIFCTVSLNYLVLNVS